jgi:hypothetical protein
VTSHVAVINAGKRDNRPIDKRSVQWEKDAVVFYVATVVDYIHVETRTIVYCDEVVSNCIRHCKDIDPAARDKLILQKTESLLGFLSGSANVWSSAKGGSAEVAMILATNKDMDRTRFIAAREQGGAVAHYTEKAVVYTVGAFVLVSILLYLAPQLSQTPKLGPDSSQSTRGASYSMRLAQWCLELLQLWWTLLTLLQRYLELFTGFAGTCLSLLWATLKLLLHLLTRGSSGILAH